MNVGSGKSTSESYPYPLRISQRLRTAIGNPLQVCLVLGNDALFYWNNLVKSLIEVLSHTHH